MKSNSIFRLFIVLTTLFVCYGVNAQTDSVVWANTTKPPTGFPTSAFDSAGYNYGSKILTAKPYTFAKMGIYKTLKPVAATSVYLPWGTLDSSLSIREFAPTDTGTGSPVTLGTWEGGDTLGLPSRYIDFSFTTSSTFTVTKIVAPVFSGGGTTCTGSYFYSTDGVNFTLLISGKSQAKVAAIVKTDYTLNNIDIPNVVLNAGQTFYFRFLPMSNSTKTATGKGLGFSRITILGSKGTLSPVSFRSLIANLINGKSLINWSAENEINTVSYSIEKSSNGIDFTEIGSVAASKSVNYSYTDLSPVSNNYYRIKSIDADGSYLYSSVVKVSGQVKSGVTVYPNPVLDRKINIQLDGLAGGLYTANVYSINGQKVASSTISLAATSLSTLPLSASIKSGVYQLELTNGTSRVTKTIFVK